VPFGSGSCSHRALSDADERPESSQPVTASRHERHPAAVLADALIGRTGVDVTFDAEAVGSRVIGCLQRD
jgi:hypothetical protein